MKADIDNRVDMLWGGEKTTMGVIAPPHADNLKQS
jgi:hypothetical protein